MSLYPSPDFTPDNVPPGIPVVEPPNVVKGVPVKGSDVIHRSDAADDSEEGSVLPEPGLRGEVGKVLSHSVEAHTVCSACLLVVALLCESLASLDPPRGIGDAPSSLRMSSLIAVLIYASPALKGINIIDQRFVLIAVLVALSFAGEQYAGLHTRIGDICYTGFTMLLAVQVYSAGGIESDDLRPDGVDNANSPHRRQTMSGLCSGLLLYVGLRGFRTAFSSAEEARVYKLEYVVGEQIMETYGYAHSAPACTIPLGFGYGVAIGIALVIGLHGEAHVTGSSAVAFEVGTCATIMAVAAMWAMLGSSEQFDALGSLYGVGACGGDRDTCKEAWRARRFASANNSTAPLWVAAMAGALFSFAVEKRLTGTELTRAERLWMRQGFSVGGLIFIVALAGAFSYSDSEGEQSHTDIVFVLSLIGVFVSIFGNTVTGSFIYVVSMTYEEYKLVEIYGSERVHKHLTHVTLTVTLVFMAVHVVVSAVKEVLQLRYTIRDNSIINGLLAVVATFGTSLTCGLYLASALLIAGGNGALPDDEVLRDNSGKRTTIAFILNHFVPFFAWMPLYACRCEVQLLDSYARATAYCLSVPLVAVVYVTVLSFLGAHAPAVGVVEIVPLSFAAVAALVAWVTGAFV